MGDPASVFRNGLSRTSTALLWSGLVLSVLHHADHVLRVDHSGWPFRPQVTPFTFSLLAYPMILFALFGSSRLFWWRWSALFVGTSATMIAHTLLETPRMQYSMWAYDRSLEPHAAGLHNLPDVQSSAAGVAAVVLAMSLNATAVSSTIALLIDGLNARRVPPSSVTSSAEGL